MSGIARRFDLAGFRRWNSVVITYFYFANRNHIHHIYSEKETHKIYYGITHSIDDLVKNDLDLLRSKPIKLEHLINNKRILNREVH